MFSNQIINSPVVSNYYSNPQNYLQSPNSLWRHNVVRERNGEGMLFSTAPFQSWEHTVNNQPEITFIPKTIEGLKNLVKWVNAERPDKRIRVSGFRHSSSEVTGEDNHISVSMLNLDTVKSIPAIHPAMDPANELEGIQLVSQPYYVDGKKKILCRLGGATCNYHFQNWVHDPYGGNLQWAMPLNTVLTEITFAGSNATMCHGAGINTKTLADLVKAIEFINPKGELQRVTDPEQLKAAAGCFGLLGIVTSLTLELDEMEYANLKSVHREYLTETIPPPNDRALSPDTMRHMSHHNSHALNNPADMQTAFNDFVNACENADYTEFFWFPLQKKCWINSWSKNGSKENAIDFYPQHKIRGEAGTLILDKINNHLGHHDSRILGKIHTKLVGSMAMHSLPDQKDIDCTLEDAIHYRLGIQNARTRMMEIEIPVPDSSMTGRADWSVCQKAWWDVIESVYNKYNMEYFPMRTTLEMRVLGGSDIYMAPEHGNKRTCSIEILTPVAVDANRWQAFMQEVLDKWAMLKDDQGHYLNIRPHWAKLFDTLNITRGLDWYNEWDAQTRQELQQYVNLSNNTITLPMRVYLRKIAYKDQISNFLYQMQNICHDGGYDLQDIQRRFSNPLFDELIFSNQAPSLRYGQPTVNYTQPHVGYPQPVYRELSVNYPESTVSSLQPTSYQQNGDVASQIKAIIVDRIGRLQDYYQAFQQQQDVATNKPVIGFFRRHFSHAAGTAENHFNALISNLMNNLDRKINSFIAQKLQMTNGVLSNSFIQESVIMYFRDIFSAVASDLNQFRNEGSHLNSQSYDAFLSAYLRELEQDTLQLQNNYLSIDANFMKKGKNLDSYSENRYVMR